MQILGLLRNSLRVLAFGGACVFGASNAHAQTGPNSPVQPGSSNSIHEGGVGLPGEPTPLQLHSAFFDRNKDGFITIGEDYEGLVALGIHPIIAGPLATGLNIALGIVTSDSFIPSTTIDLRNIHRSKHGSDTDIYDEDGRFVAANFERLFADWDKDGDGALDLSELAASRIGQKDAFDFIGFIASSGEFGLLYAIAAENGKISKERLHQMYDGTLFYRIEAERKARG